MLNIAHSADEHPEVHYEELKPTTPVVSKANLDAT